MASSFDFDPVRRARYSQGAGIYRILPAAVARPATLADLRALLAEAAASALPVTPRGAGSAMDGGNLGEGVVLDLTAFEAGRCTIDSAARQASLSPSVTLAALNHAAAPAGLRFPPDPSSGGWATLGGMASTNASGARTVRYGSVRGWIEALRLETSEGPLELTRGVAPDPEHPVVRRWRLDVEPRIRAHADEIARRFPKVRKNSFGYALDRCLASGDLLDLVIGAEGTLGVISDLRCRLDAVPPHRVALRILVRSRAALVPVMDALRRAEASSIEFLDRTFLQLIDPALAGDAAALIPESGGVLLAEIEGEHAGDVEQRARAALAAVPDDILHASLAVDPDEIAALWRIRHGASPALARLDDGRRSLQIIEDGAVPPERLPAYLDAIDAACRAEGIDVVLFGHAGDGHVHANLLPDLSGPDWEARVGRIYAAVNAAVIALGGTPSGEHGTGRLRAGLLEACYGPVVVALFEAVKAAFDPSGLMNPGVLLPAAGAAPLVRLKVGPGAAILPEGMDAWLRGIEEGARWGTSRWRVS